MKETVVERHLMRRSVAAGGDCMKIMPVVAGYPDRLVVLPRNRFFFVETKQPKGEIRPAQRVFAQRKAEIGITVYFLWTKEAVDEWMDARLAEGQDPLPG